ncbi:hypothetical protein ASD00_15770 [Ensifer sp. Root31]|uniref:DUF1284 domain-containing protein n=1 Tax=Ensifer sp. Root31 TaxID=1736512 RepID=UPI00070FC198|nr:DUF1284 domain-containing protein [Ensifer sp. Root31]KQU72270.1 hypothetical protein ASD00_15770 [Ensifer sp. Root31]MDP9628128.1 hypothetical protein [Ensifer adhaerens]
MTVQLRGHHLLCLLTFVGEGYTPTFTRNYVRIAERLSSGESVTVVDGPDDICVPMLCDAGAHCREDSIARRDSLALAAIANILDRSVADGKAAAVCVECEWAGLCSRVADSGFRDVLVRAGTDPCSLREEV